ncbi:MAG TPA: vWA domain-containing protein [Lautropia sp.]|jgi:hypothetical protein|nr:vWA domain-containing protein [Lautropia sp.]
MSAAVRLVPPFHYQVAWQPRGWRPGEHPAAVNGEGGSFRGERLLADASQARFLSVRASIRDPLRRLWVRENQQRATLDIFVVVDVSRSMRVAGQGSCCLAAADLLASAALSAYRGGDRVGVVCASGRIHPDLSAAPSRQLPPLFEIAQRIRALPQQGGRVSGLDSVDAMLDVWRRLSARRSLVLIVSDFHAPTRTWTSILQTLRHHQVVPIVLHGRDRVPDLPKWGLVHLDDAETGRSRTLLMRPSLQRRLTESIAQRRADLDAMFEELGLRPCRLRQPFDPAQLTDYFHAGGLRTALAENSQGDPTVSGAGTIGNRSPSPQPAQ